MYITKIGYNYCHDADFKLSRPFGSGDYMLLLLKTTAIFNFNGYDIITEPDSFVLYSENQPQLYRANGPQFSNDWIHFKLDEADALWFDKLSIPLNEVIHIGYINDLSIIINNLCTETYGASHYKSEIVELYLKLFFIKLSNKVHNFNNAISNTHYNKLSIIRTKIYNEPHLNWTIEDMAYELTMSKSTFQHLYKDYFGVSPITDVILSRIETAKHLLYTTDIPVKKVSEMCGYNNEIHFMRQFKKQTKITPTEYRKHKKG